jgi:hypothetical protein
MKRILLAMCILALFLTPSRANEYSVSLYFEQSESALTSLFRAEAFPHPIGYHNGDHYDIYLWEPVIDIEPGVVNFIFTINADVVINGNSYTYQYPFTIPLIIPSVNISVSGVATILNGISDQIDSMEGPQWVKDIIIDEYEGLSITTLPDQVLEDASSSIPDGIDVGVVDFACSFEVIQDKLLYTITLSYDVTAPWFEGWYNEYTDQISFRFKSNVRREIKYFTIYDIAGDPVPGSTLSNPGIILTPNEWSYINLGGDLWPGKYFANVIFCSEYGWTGIVFSFFDNETTIWRQMTPENEI